jgi:50S ribosomal subunit-associated GTPase HflX
VTAAGSVILVGLFSAKERDHRARLDALEAKVTVLGGRVVKRFTQRRGVSDGGVRLMSGPLSRRFLIGSGKLDEIATTCANDDIDAVIFINDLNGYQRRSLSKRLGCLVFTQADLDQPGQRLTRPIRPAPDAGPGQRVHRGSR